MNLCLQRACFQRVAEEAGAADPKTRELVYAEEGGRGGIGTPEEGVCAVRKTAEKLWQPGHEGRDIDGP